MLTMMMYYGMATGVIQLALMLVGLVFLVTATYKLIKWAP
jgi:hypothetical protein